MAESKLKHTSVLIVDKEMDYGIYSFLLDDKEKLGFLINYAKEFRQSAEDAIRAGDRSKLPSEIEKRDADVFMQNGDRNFKQEFTRLAAKYFTKQIHGDGVNSEYALGKYDDSTRKSLNKMDDLRKAEYKAKVKHGLYGKDKDFEKYLSAGGDAIEYALESGLSSFASDGKSDERMSDYAPDKKLPVCSHYAPTMGVMMHSAEIPGYVFINEVIQSDLHAYYPHASFITEDGVAIIEASTKDAKDAYRPVLAANKVEGEANAIDALKNGGRVMVMTYNNKGNSARIYTTDSFTEEAEVASARYAMSVLERTIDRFDWQGNVNTARSAMHISRLEDLREYQFDIPEVKNYAKKDTDIWPGKVNAVLPTSVDYRPTEFDVEMAKIGR